MFLPILALVSAAVLPPSKLGISCLSGVWHVSTACALFEKHQFDAIAESLRSTGFSLDIDPSRWSHRHCCTFSLLSETDLTFSIRTNRLSEIGSLAIVVSQKCRIHTNSTFRIGNHTIFGVVKAGKGVLSVVGLNGDVCDFSVQKELSYESWRFSLSILFGIAAMYAGFQALIGRKRPGLLKPAVIPMEAPEHAVRENAPRTPRAPPARSVRFNPEFLT
jgi:hypothetical protein